MKKESIMTGAMVLTVAGILTRLIGFYYRIYMTKMIGSEGVGLYQLIMPIYLLSWTITSSGITTTVSTLSAKSTALNRHNESLSILKSAVFTTAFLSLIVGSIVFFFSGFISEFIIKDIRAQLPLKILALCFPFMSMGSSIRGYFFGARNTVIPALSQITEQLVRVFSVIIIFSLYKPKSLSYACSVTVIGIALGEFISFLFTYFSFLHHKKHLAIQSEYKSINYIPTILKSAVPLSFGRILSSLLSTLENIMIPQKLVSFGYTESNALSVYGKLTGMAMPLVQFPTAVLVSFSTALAPAISASADIKKSPKIKQTIEKSLLLSSVTGVWALTVFAFFPKQASSLLYNQASLGTMVILLAPLCPFLYTNITLSGILNGIGRQKTIFINNITSSLINLFFINFFINTLGINAFILGMFLSLFATTAISLVNIKLCCGIHFDIKKIVLKPLASSVCSGIIIKLMPFSESFSKPVIILLISAASVLYLTFIVLTGCLTFSDLKSFLPSKKQRK